MHKMLLCAVIGSLCLPDLGQANGDYSDYPELGSLIQELEGRGLYEHAELTELFANVSRQTRVLEAIARPAEKRKEWFEYRPQFLEASRIRRGQLFWEEHADTLERAQRLYGVPPEVILAIIGVETSYGRNKGRFKVLDSLTSLALDYPPRAPFFRKELIEFLELAKREGLDPADTRGSYAGAMGYPQFMPSSWRAYAVDFDGDGHRNLIDNPVDAIGSVGSYFKAHGWVADAPVVARAQIVGEGFERALSDELKPNSTVGELASLGLAPVDGENYPANLPASARVLQGESGPEYWLTFQNFYVISRYNQSTLYSMAVHQLSQEIRAGRASRQE